MNEWKKEWVDGKYIDCWRRLFLASDDDDGVFNCYCCKKKTMMNQGVECGQIYWRRNGMTFLTFSLLLLLLLLFHLILLIVCWRHLFRASIMIEVGVLVCYYYCRKKRIEELLCWWLWLLHGLLDSWLDCMLHCLCGFMVGVDCWISGDADNDDDAMTLLLLLLCFCWLRASLEVFGKQVHG